MKRMFLIALALCLCMTGIGYSESMDVFNGFELLRGETADVDLNGDGVMEHISWDSFENAEEYTEEFELSVLSDDSTGSTWSEYIYSASVFVSDCDSDGMYEVFVCGDEMSDDYVTFCFHYTEYGLLPMLFKDASRGTNDDGYYGFGYGYIVSIVDGAVTLSGSQDILGTRFGTRAFGLQDGKFELVDDGMWRFDYYDLEDEEVWEYASITPVMDIPAMFMENGDEYEGVVKAGEKLLITASDKVSVVYFRMQDGRQGYFYVELDPEYGWGHYINGVHESEVFEFLPYAD